MLPVSLLRLIILVLVGSALSIQSAAAIAGAHPARQELPAAPVLSIRQHVSQEPLLGGDIAYTLTIANGGTTPVADRGYNLTITDTLPNGLQFVSASPAATFVAQDEATGTTTLTWDNIADLEARETLELTIVARLNESLTLADTFTNQADAAVNTMPDNSGTWVRATSSSTARPQALDINMQARQSTADEQASGAGDYPERAPGRESGADWPYRYHITVQNNRLIATNAVTVVATLPPGVAYLGNPAISPNPNQRSAAPSLSLRDDGSLQLGWQLGTLTTAQHDAPIVLTFDAAIPYRFRSASDTAAASGPFAGPMRGAIIPEDTPLLVHYEASGIAMPGEGRELATSDGSNATPADDMPARVTAEYLTVSKRATPGLVGIGDEVIFTLAYAASEYYALDHVVLTDVLPDGMTYVAGSATQEPRAIQPDTPAAGQTTLIWDIPANSTTPGSQGSISLRATVDPAYEAAPVAGEPIVSGDSLTNQATISGDWRDMVETTRQGTLAPDTSTAHAQTRMPTFTKEVWDAQRAAWSDVTQAFTGDTIRFRLRYAAADTVDARDIVIRDFLPRGMTYVPDSAAHTVTGSFRSSTGCTSTPEAPTVGSLGGLTYLEWRLCRSERGSTWQAIIEARVGNMPDIQPGWIVANFGKLSGQNTAGTSYSLRDMGRIDYTAPALVLSKTASPDRGLVAGDTVAYTIAVTNQGDAPAYNLVVRDIIPADLLLASDSSYTTRSGNPTDGSGGVIEWAPVARLAPGETRTFAYTAAISGGLPAGQSMTNQASVAYNSRADDAGHQWSHTDDPADPNTAAATVYVRGLSVEKRADYDTAAIGEVIPWTLTVEVPAGVVAFWPVLEENNLPAGFDFIPGSTQISTDTLPVQLDTTHHPQNPRDNGNRDLRWYFQTIDNSQSSRAERFTVRFATLVTGVQGTNPQRSYYPDTCCLSPARNTAAIGWYDTASGYNGQGFAYGESFRTDRIDRRSPPARHTIQIRQPHLILFTSAERSTIEAGDEVRFTIQATNLGNDIAHDIVLSDALPEGLRFVATEQMTLNYPFEPAPTDVQMRDDNAPGSSVLAYDLNVLHVGATWTIVVRAQVDTNIAADRELVSTARIEEYSSQPGTPPDRNADGLPDERSYSGSTAAASVYTPQASLHKAATLADGADELAFGGEIVYTLTVPAAPINATLYDVTITDTLDSRLAPQQVSADAGTVAQSGQRVSVQYARIDPGEQRSITIRARLPESSTARDGERIVNQATLTHRHGAPHLSNSVAQSVAAPALVVRRQASQPVLATGDTLTYTTTIANVGSGRAVALQASEEFPPNLRPLSGTATLNGQPFADPVAGAWNLPDLASGTQHVLTIQAQVAAVAAGEPYASPLRVSGYDSRARPIPADNHRRVAADIDADDRATARAYGGPLQAATWSTFVAYEDLKNTGWSDWDYNDLVVQIDVEQLLTPAGDLAVLRLRYEVLARGAGFDHAFWHHIPVAGGGHAALTVMDAAGATLWERSQPFTDTATFEVFPRTRAALPEAALPTWMLPDHPFVNTMEEQPGTVPGYTAELLLVLDAASANPTRAAADGTLRLAHSLLALPWDPYIVVHDTGEEIHLVIPGHLDNMQQVNGSFNPNTPLLGHDLPLAQVFRPAWRWPIEYEGIWMGYPGYVGHINSGGRGNRNWFDSRKAATQWLWHAGAAPSDSADSARLSAAPASAPASVYFAGPTVADLEGNGTAEIVIGNLVANRVEVYDTAGEALAGWPQATAGGVKARTTVADLDGDGDGEILAGDSTGTLYAWHHDGQAVAGWPIQVGAARILAAPAVADIDGGGVDVVLPLADGWLYAFNADGTPKAGWPVSIGGVQDSFGSQVLNSSPRIADMDGDGSAEIIVGSMDHRLYVFAASGALRWSFGAGDSILSTPAVADIDAARPGLEIAFGAGDGVVYLLDSDGGLLWRQQTGWTVRSSPLAADMDQDGDLEVLIGSDDDSLYAWHHDGQAVAGWPQQTGADVFSSPALGDVDGDGAPEVVVGSDDARVYAWHANGQTVAGWPQQVSASVKGQPVLLNLDDDPAAEVMVGDVVGTLARLPSATAAQRVYLPLVRR
jgi:LruC domain-containing protein/uncharacterized repeat protein (TIGR01451 family)/fimbrial isopeptide formation D2 family protein